MAFFFKAVFAAAALFSSLAFGRNCTRDSSESSTNLAVYGASSQSSTRTGRCNLTASKATDRNTEGLFSWCSITHTNEDVNAWWEVDLKDNSVVYSVTVFNRIDCCMNRLSKFDVILKNQSDDVLRSIYEHQGGREIMAFPINPTLRSVRYVRVQLRGTDFLSLAEVYVYGENAIATERNLALFKPAAQSSTASDWGCPASASAAVDGNTEGLFHPWCSVTHTNSDHQAWWRVDLQGSRTVHRVRVFNRISQNVKFLVNFNVTLQNSDKAMLASKNFPAGTNTQIYTFSKTVENVRFVCVHLLGKGILSLAEVQVIGDDKNDLNDVNDWNGSNGGNDKNDGNDLNDGSGNIAAASPNPFPVLPVVGSFVFPLVLIFIAVAVGVCCYRGKCRSANLSSPAPESRSGKRSDEWEINRCDVTLLEKIGEGLFGVVHKAELLHDPSSQGKTVHHRNSNKSFVACKLHKGKRQLEDDFLEEINLMKQVGRHQHIVSLVACITESQPLSLIVEYCCHGDLLKYLRRGRHVALDRRHSEHEENEKGKGDDEVESDDDDENIALKFTTFDLLSFAWQIGSGMDYLSGKGLVHRDLACRNVLVCENQLLKVSDFGLTRAVYEDGQYSQKTSRRLPLRWMSIDAITRRLFTEKSDVWSFGVVVWEIFTLGGFPYPWIVSKDLQSHLLEGNRLLRPDSCSEELYKLISECWRTNPSKRPTFNALSRKLGKLLEAESPNKYIRFESASLYPIEAIEWEDSPSEATSTV